MASYNVWAISLFVIFSCAVKCYSYCPSPYREYNQSACFYLYYAHTGTVTYQTAKRECQSKFPNVKGSLASLDSLDQENWIIENLLETQTSYSYPTIWIGLKRNGSDFYWLDGNPSDFRHWQAGEPNKRNNVEEDCVHIDFRYDLQRKVGWNDLDCNLDRIDGYVCRTDYIRDNNSLSQNETNENLNFSSNDSADIFHSSSETKFGYNATIISIAESSLSTLDANQTLTDKKSDPNYHAIIGVSCFAGIFFIIGMFIFVGLRYRRYKIRQRRRRQAAAVRYNNNKR